LPFPTLCGSRRFESGSRRTASPPADIADPNSGGGLAVIIINRIFEQYARGADLAAVWQETSTSRPFRLEQLAHDSR
jgi:hypothetical protein